MQRLVLPKLDSSGRDCCAASTCRRDETFKAQKPKRCPQEETPKRRSQKAAREKPRLPRTKPKSHTRTETPRCKNADAKRGRKRRKQKRQCHKTHNFHDAARLGRTLSSPAAGSGMSEVRNERNEWSCRRSGAAPCSAKVGQFRRRKLRPQVLAATPKRSKCRSPAPHKNNRAEMQKRKRRAKEERWKRKNQKAAREQKH